MKYSQHVNKRQTAQNERADAAQVLNSAGGYSFAVDDWKRLERFLILGNEGGSYYASEKAMTKDAANAVERCLKADYRRTIDVIVDVSMRGRAPKNDPAIFALAIAAGSDNQDARKYALSKLGDVCRIGTHLFQFVSAVENFRGWGRGLRNAVGSWYTTKNPDQLALQVLKYQNREGWSHRDVLRLAHTTPTAEQNAVLRWAVSGFDGLGERSVKGKGAVPNRSYAAVENVPALLSGYEMMKRATSAKEVVSLIETYGFTHEMVMNEWKNDKDVWAALLRKMPYTAMIRNLAKMTNVGLIAPLSDATKVVCEKLNDGDAIRKARVHPVAILVALLTYQQGHGNKGKLTWKADQRIVDALNDAFYAAFETVEPTGKNYLLGIDVSGSMGYPGLNGVDRLVPRVCAAAMAMTVARTEQNYHVMGFSTRFVELKISPKMRLDRVVSVMDNLPFSRTDCALPMIFAKQNNMKVDVFATFTDSETWAGRIHPHQALRKYRNTSGVAAKNAVFGMTSNGFTIADPNDAGQMDFVGFDAAAPSVFADFARG